MNATDSYSDCYDFERDRLESRDRAHTEDEARIYGALLDDAEAIAQAWADNAIDLNEAEVAAALRMPDEAAGNALIGAKVRQIVQQALRRTAEHRREQAEADRRRAMREACDAWEAREAREARRAA